MKFLPRKNRIKQAPLPGSHKLFILQVFSGLKRSGTFDGIACQDTKTIKAVLSLLRSLGLSSRVIKTGRNVKILLSRGERDLSRLYKWHQNVFRQATGFEEYGRLLGYPECCVSAFLDYNNPWKWIVDPAGNAGRISKSGITRYSPDYRMNRFAGIIYHLPCSFDCRKTLALSDNILRLYKDYDPCLTEDFVDSLRKPVVTFKSCNYVRLSGNVRGSIVRYNAVDCVDPSSMENGRLSEQDRDIRKVTKIIREGNKLFFRKGYFAVFRDGVLLEKVDFQKMPFCLLDFS